jgi:hypothetical protein
MKLNEFLTEGEIISFKTGKPVDVKPVSMMQAFGSPEMNVLDSVGIRLNEKPSYWEDLDQDRVIDQVSFARLKKALAKENIRLPEYSSKEIYGRDPRGPQVSVSNMPQENMLIINFENGNKYLVDTSGARTYIRYWSKIQ